MILQKASSLTATGAHEINDNCLPEKKKKKRFIRTGAVLLLVGVVQTVVVAVAHPRLGYASHVVAREVPRVRARRHRRLGVRVSHAGPAVRVHLLAVRATALGLEPGRILGRHAETELLAAAVVGRARARMRKVYGLLVFAVNLHAVQPVVLRLAHLDVGHHARQLVYLDDGVQPPVGDVHPVCAKRGRLKSGRFRGKYKPKPRELRLAP